MDNEILKMKRKLSDHDLAILNSEMEKHRKSVGLTYLLWFFLGLYGAHKFYLGKVADGIAYLLGSLIGPILFFAGFASENGSLSVGTGAIILFAILTCWAIDLFTIPIQVKKSLEKAEMKVLDDLHHFTTP